jgi:hypothetical protein
MISWFGWFGWFGSIRFESSRFDSWYAVGAKPVCIVLAIGVTLVSLSPLISVGNLGAWSCLDDV